MIANIFNPVNLKPKVKWKKVRVERKSGKRTQGTSNSLTKTTKCQLMLILVNRTQI